MSTKRKALGLASILVVAAVVALVATGTFQKARLAAAEDPVAVLEAVHYAWGGTAYDMPVEPQTGEHVAVTVTFTGPPLAPVQYVASVDVDWNGSSWVLSNASVTGWISGFAICDGEQCGSQIDPHGYGYKLQVQTVPVSPYNPYRADFLVSSVDDGYTLTGTPCDCDTSGSNPAPYVSGVTDRGFFEASLSCSNTGASLAIPYE